MKILPNPIDHFFRPVSEAAQGHHAGHRPRTGEGPAHTATPTDRVEISAQGRKEQIQREMVSEIIRKIR